MQSSLIELARAITRIVARDVGSGILTREKERRLLEFLARH